jgi:hypothetical protein
MICFNILIDITSKTTLAQGLIKTGKSGGYIGLSK